MRILATRLTEAQRYYLRAQVNGKWQTLTHAAEKLAERNIGKDQVLRCIAHGEIVQFQREDDGLRRLLIRAQDGTCVVLDIDRKLMVTAYHNNPKDQHMTLNRDAYYWGKVNDQMLRRIL